MKKTILLLFMVTAALNAQETQKQASISVSGEGIVKITPDEAVLNIRVEHTGNAAQEVKTMNDNAVKEVLQFCKKMKVDKKDVKTQYINLSKNYDYQKKKYHYKANQSISIRLRDLKKYEALMQGLLESGVNRVDGVQFKSSQLKKHQSEARKKAVLNAKKKAMEYAGALNQSVGKAIIISENAGYTPRPMLSRTARVSEMATASDSGPAIAIGEMTVSATVNVTFELQ